MNISADSVIIIKSAKTYSFSVDENITVNCVS